MHIIERWRAHACAERPPVLRLPSGCYLLSMSYPHHSMNLRHAMPVLNMKAVDCSVLYRRNVVKTTARPLVEETRPCKAAENCCPATARSWANSSSSNLGHASAPDCWRPAGFEAPSTLPFAHLTPSSPVGSQLLSTHGFPDAPKSASMPQIFSQNPQLLDVGDGKF